MNSISMSPDTLNMYTSNVEKNAISEHEAKILDALEGIKNELHDLNSILMNDHDEIYRMKKRRKDGNH